MPWQVARRAASRSSRSADCLMRWWPAWAVAPTPLACSIPSWKTTMWPCMALKPVVTGWKR
eukprot:55399-Eustigmatos_ZCMA.PRE.1